MKTGEIAYSGLYPSMLAVTRPTATSTAPMGALLAAGSFGVPTATKPMGEAAPIGNSGSAAPEASHPVHTMAFSWK